MNVRFRFCTIAYFCGQDVAIPPIINQSDFEKARQDNLISKENYSLGPVRATAFRSIQAQYSVGTENIELSGLSIKLGAYHLLNKQNNSTSLSPKSDVSNFLRRAAVDICLTPSDMIHYFLMLSPLGTRYHVTFHIGHPR